MQHNGNFAQSGSRAVQEGMNNLFSSFGPTKQTELEEFTCWKTNLMLEEEEERVDERSKIFRRRTSFEDNLINEHIKLMLRTVRETDLQLIPIDLPSNDVIFAPLKEAKQIEDIDSNIYLTEEEKWELTGLVLTNQQNFSIFFRLAMMFKGSKNQLVYLLLKILNYCSTEIHLREREKNNKSGIVEVMQENRVKLMNGILNQQNVKLMNPLFFSNVNEQPLMRIVENWFYHVICIKQGLYSSEEEQLEGEETYFEEENLFEY